MDTNIYKPIYFGQHTINFRRDIEVIQKSCNQPNIIHTEGPITDANVAKILQDVKSDDIYIATRNIAKAREQFASHFKCVTAAGGIVSSATGQNLLIYRNGMWDLPKGHMEKNESAVDCARREIFEETGVDAKIECYIGNTNHIYNVYGEWVLKQTHWFQLSIDDICDTLPQQEEGIERAVWFDSRDAYHKLSHNSYPAMRELVLHVEEYKNFD